MNGSMMCSLNGYLFKNTKPTKIEVTKQIRLCVVILCPLLSRHLYPIKSPKSVDSQKEVDYLCEDPLYFGRTLRSYSLYLSKDVYLLAYREMERTRKGHLSFLYCVIT